MELAIGHNLNTTQALQFETRPLKTVLVRGKGVDLLNGHSSRAQDLIELCGQDHGDVRLSARDQSTVAIGLGGVGEVKDGLDIVEVDVQTEPIGEQASALDTIRNQKVKSMELQSPRCANV